MPGDEEGESGEVGGCGSGSALKPRGLAEGCGADEMRLWDMDLLWRILAALSLDCFRPDSSSSRSPARLSSSPAGSLDSSSLTGSLSLGLDLPHCQCCISHGGRLKRLSCGHLYCGPCCDQIVNLAFEDIEGLSDYPCPMCKSLRQLGGLGGHYSVLQEEPGSSWG